jgi:hypothetical protein
MIAHRYTLTGVLGAIFDTGHKFQLPLPPGRYKILLPDFDIQTSRWDVEIESHKTTRINFDVNWNVAKTAEETTPYKPNKKRHLTNKGPIGIGPPR